MEPTKVVIDPVLGCVIFFFDTYDARADWMVRNMPDKVGWHTARVGDSPDEYRVAWRLVDLNGPLTWLHRIHP